MRLIQNFILLVLLTGCGVEIVNEEDDWELLGNDTVWVSPGKTANRYGRMFNGYMASIYKTEWELSNGKRIERDTIQRKIAETIRGLPDYPSWPDSRDKNKKFAPYYFYMVSLDPLVVILSERDLPSNFEGMSVSQIRGELPEKYFFISAVDNHIEYGTYISNDNVSYWFSPEFSRNLNELKFQSNEALVSLKEHSQELLIFRSEGVWKTERRSNKTRDQIAGTRGATD